MLSIPPSCRSRICSRRACKVSRQLYNAKSCIFCAFRVCVWGCVWVCVCVYVVCMLCVCVCVWLWFSWIYLPGTWIHNQDYEYYACLVHLLYIQLVTKHYAVIFLLQAANAIALYHSEHICDQVAMLASSMLVNHTWTLHGGPVRWRFSGPWPYS